MVNKTEKWFDVDKNGLQELQLGKSKSYIVRELIANAWDEETAFCQVNTSYRNGGATISVEDDSPDGFKDLTDSYTLFKHTDKRSNPEKRGRYNLGEKQVLAVCKEATIESTNGTIKFNKDNTRSMSKARRDKGTKITLKVRMTKADYDEILETLNHYLSPQNILTTINGKPLQYKQPIQITHATLQTELEHNGVFSKTERKTRIEIHEASGESYLYEMQIPVTKIDCPLSIDIQQKIPLDKDRETVSQAFLQDVYAEVLNAMYNEIPKANSSDNWIRQATSDPRISPNALEAITKKRFGDRVLVNNPNDRNANDEAIAKGYRVIQGPELSGNEWQQLKQKAPIASTTAKFGAEEGPTKDIVPTSDQIKVAEYAKRLHKKLNNIDLVVRFVERPRSNALADYGHKTLTFNVSSLDKDFFKDHLKTTDLILHELGHEFGNHTQHSYHEALTRFAQQLVIIALEQPCFFI